MFPLQSSLSSHNFFLSFCKKSFATRSKALESRASIRSESENSKMS